jgi:hypothetical protein
MMNIYIVIKTKDEYLEMLQAMQKMGYLRDLKEESLSESCFPVELAVDLEKVLSEMKNPIVKMFGKKIDTAIEAKLVSQFGA